MCEVVFVLVRLYKVYDLASGDAAIIRIQKQYLYQHSPYSYVLFFDIEPLEVCLWTTLK